MIEGEGLSTVEEHVISKLLAVGEITFEQFGKTIDMPRESWLKVFRDLYNHDILCEFFVVVLPKDLETMFGSKSVP